MKFNKKPIKILSLCSAALFFLSSLSAISSAKQNDKISLPEPPILSIEFESSKGDVKSIELHPRTSSWHVQSEENPDMIAALETDSLSPFSSLGSLSQSPFSGNQKVKINSPLKPNSIKISKLVDWQTIVPEYNCELILSPEPVKDDSGSFTHNKDLASGYIYEIHATWAQGDAYYAFYIPPQNYIISWFKDDQSDKSVLDVDGDSKFEDSIIQGYTKSIEGNI